MDNELERLRQGLQQTVPSDYLTFDRNEKRYLNYKKIVTDAIKKQKQRMSMQESINQLVLEYSSERYERLSLFPLFVLWFHDITSPGTGDPTETGKKNAFDAISTKISYREQARITAEMTPSLYAIRVVAAFIEQESQKLKTDREIYVSIKAKRSLIDPKTGIKVRDQITTGVHDLEISEASSTFVPLVRPSETSIFDTIELDNYIPFVAQIYKHPDGKIDAKYKIYAAASDEEKESWMDTIAKKVDPTREVSDRDTKTEVLILVMYRRILNSKLENNAIGDEDVEEEEEEHENDEDEREEEEEENLKNVAVERRPMLERERAFTKLSYDGHRFVLKLPDDVIDPKSRDILESFIFERLKTPKIATNLISVKGVFAMFDLAVVPELLLHLISTDRRFSPLFYIIEAQKSYAEKERLTLHYAASSTRHVMMSFSRLQYTKITDIFRKKGRIVGYNGKRYFQVKLSKATDREIAVEAREMLLRLFEVYMEREEELADLYQHFFPNIPRLEAPVLEMREEPLTAFEEAKLIAPNIFRKQGRALQSKSQVRIVTTESLLHPSEQEIEKDPDGTEKRRIEAEKRMKEFSNRVDVDKGVKIEILYYRGVYYTSEIKGRPYMGFKKTRSTKGVKVPSCFASQQIEIHPETFREIVKKQSKRSKPRGPVKAVKPIETLKILKPERLGMLPSAAKTIISRYAGTDRNHIRYGVPYSPNALIHCACAALELRDYKLSDKKELFVQNVRTTELIKYAASAKQELYDYSVDEISRELASNSWLDPRKYYRVVEEWMRAKSGSPIPMRVFLLEMTEERGIRVIVPRHKLFHIRDYHENAVAVLMFVHIGQECNNATHDQVELIVSKSRKPRDTEIKYTYPQLNDVLLPEEEKKKRKISLDFRLLKQLQKILLDSSMPKRLELIEHNGGPECSIVSNFHDIPNASVLFSPLKVISQEFDSYGKLRAVRLSDRKDPLKTVVVLTPPLAPIGGEGNDTAINEEKLYGIRTRNAIAHELVTKLRSLPKGTELQTSIEDRNRMVIRFHLGGVVDGFSVLVDSSGESGGESVSDTSLHGISELEKLQRLKKALPRVLAHVETMYNHEYERGNDLTGEQLVSEYCIVREGYDYVDAIVEDNVAVLDSNKMRDWLVRYVNLFVRVGKRLPPSLLSPPHQPIGTRITYIPNTEMLEEWNAFVAFDDPSIHTTFDFGTLSETYQPYFFEHEGKLKCMQMTRGNKKEHAIACCYNWAMFKVNTAYYTLVNDDVQVLEETKDRLQLEETGMDAYSVLLDGVKDNVVVSRFVYNVDGKEREYWGAVLDMGLM